MPVLCANFVEKLHRIEDAKDRKASLKLRCFRLRGVHQVEQILVARDDELGVGRKCDVDVVCIVGVALVSEDFGETVEKCGRDFDRLEKLFHSIGNKVK